jgi:hypothetical protein
MSGEREIVPGVARPPRREDYEPLIRGLRPFCEGEELQIRASLMLMRDRAMATKYRSSEPGWHLLDVVERIASDNAMNHQLDIEALREMRRLCNQCVTAARDFDLLFQPRLPLDDGEAN